MADSLLDAPERARRATWPYLLTVGAHSGAAALVGAVVIQPSMVNGPAAPVDFIEVEPRREARPHDGHEPSPAPVVPEPTPIRKWSPQSKNAPLPEVSPPTAAAQAGKVSSQESDVIDLSHTFVVGSSSKYAGGTSDSTGSNTRAVRNSMARGAGNGGTANVAASTAQLVVNLSRPPRLSGGASWYCPFPPEADVRGINTGLVSLEIGVGAAGQVFNVHVLREPGHGFGLAAKRCALSKRWDPGLDDQGRAVDATAVVNVRFTR